MNKNRRITLETNRNISIEFTNERIIPASGLAVVGALPGKSDFIKKLNRMDVTKSRSQHQIKNGDIVLTYLGMLCMGKPYFEAVHEMDDDKDFYRLALGITRSIPSEETLRQRTLICSQHTASSPRLWRRARCHWMLTSPPWTTPSPIRKGSPEPTKASMDLRR